MTKGRFYSTLAILSIIVSIGMALLLQTSLLQAYSGITAGSIIFFVLLSIVVYHLGFRIAHLENKNAFTSFIMAFIFGKMMLSLIFLACFYILSQPSNKYFLVPFFLVYLCYTIFETYVLSVVGNMEVKTSTSTKD